MRDTLYEIFLAIARILSQRFPLRIRHTLTLLVFLTLFLMISLLQETGLALGYSSVHPIRAAVQQIIPAKEKSLPILINSSIVLFPYYGVAECLIEGKQLLNENGYVTHEAQGSSSVNGYNSEASGSASIRCYEVGNKTVAIIIASDQHNSYSTTGNTVDKLRNQLFGLSRNHKSNNVENMSFEEFDSLEPYHAYNWGIYIGNSAECRASALKNLSGLGFKAKIDGVNVYAVKPFVRASVYCGEGTDEESLVMLIISAISDDRKAVADIGQIRRSLYTSMYLQKDIFN